MSFAPVEIYYQHSLASLVATSAESGYPASNILGGTDAIPWKATTNATQYITFDAGVGQTYSPDYLLIFTHNLGSIGATVSLQYSTDNFAADVNDIFTPYAVPNNKVILKKFTTQAKRYWRLKISGATAAPWICYCRWGQKTVLDYADKLTPYDVERKGVVLQSDWGFLQGVHEKYKEYGLSIAFHDCDSALQAKFSEWEQAVGMGLFGVSWDATDHASDVRVLRRKDTKFSMPMKYGGFYTDVTMNLIGRYET